jgi:hypothetical protein
MLTPPKKIPVTVTEYPLKKYGNLNKISKEQHDKDRD